MTSDPPLVASIVLNYGRAELAALAVESLLRGGYPRQEVLLADNGSLDPRPAEALAAAAGVKLFRLERNHGFAEGMNLAAAEAGRLWGPDFLFLLNNDARVEPEALGLLVEAARERAAGLVGPKILLEDEPGTPAGSSSRGRPGAPAGPRASVSSGAPLGSSGAAGPGASTSSGAALTPGQPAGSGGPAGPRAPVGGSTPRPGAPARPGPPRFWAAGGSLNTFRLLASNRGEGEEDRGQFDLPEERRFLSACALMIRAEAWRRLGGFDRRFFLYQEDVDLCLRARALGLTLLYQPAARVHHRGSATGGSEYGPLQSFYRWRNRLLLFSGHARGLHRAFLFGAFFPCLAARDLLRYARRRRWVEMKALFAGLGDFLRGAGRR